jgi:rhodanese-related sulfurtransferase
MLYHDQTLLIDVDDSRAYRRSHLRKARFLTRSRVALLREPPHAGKIVVFTSRDGVLAQYAAADARELGIRAAWVKGGTAAVAETVGISGEPEFLCDTDDAWYKPYELAASQAEQEQAMRDYITWETGLIDQLENEPGVRFKVHLARQA